MQKLNRKMAQPTTRLVREEAEAHARSLTVEVRKVTSINRKKFFGFYMPRAAVLFGKFMTESKMEGHEPWR